MKYRDLITIFLVVVFILSLAYVTAVDQSIWYVSLIIFIVLIYFTYKLWMEK